MFSRRAFYAALAVCLIALVALSSSAASIAASTAAAPLVGVDHLRGRWDGTFLALQGADRPFTLLLEDFASDAQNPALTLYAGCMALAPSTAMTPVAVQVSKLDAVTFDLVMYGTALINPGAATIKVTGSLLDPTANVPGDSGAGAWTTGGEQGTWTMIHHDRRAFQCPPVEPAPGLNLWAGVSAVLGYRGAELDQRLTVYGGETNIVSSAMRVTRPDGSITVVPPFTDLFTPNVDFITNFRFSINEEGLPTPGVYTFTLLNALGQPIPGTTRTDLYTGCGIEPPRGITGAITPEGILVTWNPVPTAPGFDPGGTPPLGIYQLGVDPVAGGDDRFGSEMHQPSHLIPFAAFEPESFGIPDGRNYGKALSQMGDGEYYISVWAFAQPVPGTSAEGIKCQTQDFNARVYFQKTGSTITFIPGPLP